jgi:hypothetical protein
MRRISGIFLAIGSVTALTACNPDFDPQSLIDKPRILGVRADPPEVQFTEAEQGSVTLTAFLALPELPKEGSPGQRELKSLDWFVCFLNLGSQAGYQCAVPEQPLDSDLATQTATLDGAVLYAQMNLLRPIFPQFMEFVKQTVTQDDPCQFKVIQDWESCTAGNPDDPTPCIDAGFDAERKCLLAKGQDITIHLTATWTDGAVDFIADAYKKVYFRPITTERPANRNPSFSVWLKRTEPLESSLVTSTSAAGNLPVVLACPGQQLQLNPILDAGARETFLNTDGTWSEEYIMVSWFATAGTFDRVKSSTATATPDSPIDLSNALKMPNRATFPESFPVWVFVRDERLGMDQVQFQVRPRDEAACTRPADAPKDWKVPEPEVLPDTSEVVRLNRTVLNGGAA